MQFLDFDLLIEPAPDGYRARLLQSPAGQAQVDFQLSLEDESLQDLLAGGPTGVARDVRPGAPVAGAVSLERVRKFGGGLFDAAFGGEVRSALRRSLDEAKRQGCGLRIRLRLSDVPALANLPWEYLYDASVNRFLALSAETPVVRYLDLPEREQALAVEPPVGLLAVISNPEGVPKLDVEREWRRLQEAMADLEARGVVTVERLGSATLASLQQALRRKTIHILHFIGHGTYDDEAGEGMLILESDEGRALPVSGVRLGTLLHDHDPLRLVTLNACKGGRASVTDPFAGAAQNLVQQGVPAVIAMQFEISDVAAVALAQELYGAVADGYPVDAALAEARKAVFAADEGVEWGTPALYMRSADGRLFEVARHAGAAGAEGPAPRRRGASAPPPPPGDLADYARQLQDLASSLQARRLAYFVGADAPEALTGAPSRRDLAVRLAAGSDLDPEQGLAAVAQQVMAAGNRFKFTDAVKQALDAVTTPGPIYTELAALFGAAPPDLIVTSAYHGLLEASLSLPHAVVVRDSDLAFASGPTLLLKLFGDVRQPESLIVTEQDQNALLRGKVNPDVVDEVRRAFRRSSVLFLGYDLADPAVGALFDEVAGGRFQLPSYAVWTGLSQAEGDAYRSNRGVEVLPLDPVAVLAYLRKSLAEGRELA